MEIGGVYVHQGGLKPTVGLAPKVILESTHIKTLEYVSIQILESFNHLTS